MFTKKKSTASNAKICKLPKVQELYTGYLYKSPKRFGPTKGKKSWRHCFFVLSKEGEDNYRLAYFKNNKKRKKPLGEIDLSKVRSICSSPERHQMWEWIQKNFKCLPSSVLLLRVGYFMPKYARDYFLIGENSEDVNGWRNELLKAMKIQHSQNKVTDFDLQQVTFSDDEDDIEVHPDTPEDNSEYMPLATDTPTNGLESSQDLHNAADNPVKRHSAELRCSKGSLSDFNGNCASSEMNNGPPNKNDTLNPIKKEIYITRNYLCKSLIFTQKEGKPCVFECKQIETSHLFHKGDQILAFNDLKIETVEDIQIFLNRLIRDELKLTILQHPGSQPF